MVSEVFEYPFDLAKVRLQSQVLDNTARYGGPLDCLMQTWRTEGVRGLYRVSCVIFLWVVNSFQFRFAGAYGANDRFDG